MASETIALCVDPSLTMTGWALVRLPLDQDDRSGIFRDPVIACGTIPQKDTSLSLVERVANICQAFDGVFLKWGNPEIIALETPGHTYAKKRTKMVLGEHGLDAVESSGKSQQAIMAQQRTFGALSQWFHGHYGFPTTEVRPEETKEALTGYRFASKSVVAARIAVCFTGNTEGKLPEAWGKGKAHLEAICDCLAVAWWLDGQLRSGRISGATTDQPE